MEDLEPKYALRKLTVGLTSVMLGMVSFGAMNVHADDQAKEQDKSNQSANLTADSISVRPYQASDSNQTDMKTSTEQTSVQSNSSSMINSSNVDNSPVSSDSNQQTNELTTQTFMLQSTAGNKIANLTTSLAASNVNQADPMGESQAHWNSLNWTWQNDSGQPVSQQTINRYFFRFGFNGEAVLSLGQLTRAQTIHLFDIRQTSNNNGLTTLNFENNDTPFIINNRKVGYFHLSADLVPNSYATNWKPWRLMRMQLVITNPLTDVTGEQRVKINVPWAGTIGYGSPYSFRGVRSSRITYQMMRNNLTSQYWTTTYDWDPGTAIELAQDQGHLREDPGSRLVGSGGTVDAPGQITTDFIDPGFDNTTFGQYITSHGQYGHIDLNTPLESAARIRTDIGSLILDAKQMSSVNAYGNMPAYKDNGHEYWNGQALGNAIGSDIPMKVLGNNLTLAQIRAQATNGSGAYISQQNDGTLIYYLKVLPRDLALTDNQVNSTIDGLVCRSALLNYLSNSDASARNLATTWINRWRDSLWQGVPTLAELSTFYYRLTNPYLHTRVFVDNLDPNTGAIIRTTQNQNTINDTTIEGQAQVFVHYIDSQTGREVQQVDMYNDWPGALVAITPHLKVSGYHLSGKLYTNKLPNGKVVSGYFTNDISHITQGGQYDLYEEVVPDVVKTSISYQFMDDGGPFDVKRSPIKVGDPIVVNGNVGDTVNVNLTVPKNYQLVNGQTLPITTGVLQKENGVVEIHLTHTVSAGAITTGHAKRKIYVQLEGQDKRLQDTQDMPYQYQTMIDNVNGSTSDKVISGMNAGMYPPMTAYTAPTIAGYTCTNPDAAGMIGQTIMGIDGVFHYSSEVDYPNVVFTYQKNVIDVNPDDPSTWPADKDGHKLSISDFNRIIVWRFNAVHIHLGTDGSDTYESEILPQFESELLPQFDGSQSYERSVKYDRINNQFIFGNWELKETSKQFDNIISYTPTDGRVVVSAPVYGLSAQNSDLLLSTTSKDAYGFYASYETNFQQLSKAINIILNDENRWKYKGTNPSATINYDLLVIINDGKLDDFVRPITRIIKITNPLTNETKTITQYHCFMRPLVIDENSDKTARMITGSWSDNGSYTFDAVNVPVVAGYIPSVSQVTQLVITPDSQNNEIDVTYSPVQVTYSYQFVDDDNNGSNVGNPLKYMGAYNSETTISSPIQIPDNYQLADGQSLPTKIAFKDLSNPVIKLHLKHGTKAVTRSHTVINTVNYRMADGGVAPVSHTETLTFNEKGVQDLVTKSIKWTPSKSQKFSDVSSPVLTGYTPDKALVAGQMVNFDSQNIETLVIYQANPQAAQINYVDDITGKILHVNKANGKFNQVINFVEDPNDVIKGYIGAGYGLVSNDFNNQKYQADNTKNVFTVHLNHQHKSVDDQQTLTREIDYQVPVGYMPVPAVIQTVTLHRSGDQDLVTKRIVWQPWSTNTWATVNVQTFAGYQASQDQVEQKTVTDGMQNETVTITYRALPQTILVDYRLANGSLVMEQDFTGVTDQQLNLRSSIENSIKSHQWQLLDSSMIKQFDQAKTFMADSELNRYTVLVKPEVKTEPIKKIVTRIVHVVYPSGNGKNIYQTVVFTGVRADDQITWKQRQLGWSAYQPDAITGYQASLVTGQMVTPETADSEVTVKYQALPSSHQINFVTADGAIITSLQVHSFHNYQQNVPEGYHLISTIDPNSSQLVVNLLIEPDQQVYTSQSHNLPDYLAPLTKTITRTVFIPMNNGKMRKVVQKVTFTRTAMVSAGQVTYSDWQAVGSNHLPKVFVPKVAGKKLSYVGNLNAKTVSPTDHNQVIFVRYL